MQQSFLQSYFQAFHRIEGWFVFDAALMFMAYNQLIAGRGIVGDTLEIGVYYGLSAIAIAALRGPGRRMYAVDLFEELGPNEAYGAGKSYREKFEQHMREFYGSLDFLTPITAASGRLNSSEFPPAFSFCHVDGGHSAEETFADMKFASDLLMPGGLLALDDYFNPQHPGVCEGAIDFARSYDHVLQPLAIGYNKVLFQKLPAAMDLNGEFLKAFPAVQSVPAAPMWNTPVLLFGSPLRSHLDLYASTPQRLVPLGSAGVRAVFLPERPQLSARAGQTVSVPIVVKNTSRETFPEGSNVLGLSYHLLSSESELIQHDNARAYFSAALQPDRQVRMNLPVTAPSVEGRYRLELDLVWEGVMWFKDVGNPTFFIEFEVGK
jgi:predicted O-methyltransferase YrrM